MAKDLTINPRIIEQLSKATIRNLLDGIVELVTNSDDSYRRLEQSGRQVNGVIEIEVEREKGGRVRRLVVRDYAEGMSAEQLEKALEFAGQTSGFETGRSVRGFFGRGLKETIYGLGEGTITTVRNGTKVRTRLWIDAQTKRPKYDDDMLMQTEMTTDPDGTTVEIDVQNEKMKAAGWDKFCEQVANHYALRDIHRRREVKLSLYDKSPKGRFSTPKRCGKPIQFKSPSENKVLDEDIPLTRSGDRMRLTIYETDMPYAFSRDPWCMSGIVIKTEGAALDLVMPGFESDPAAAYFFGEAFCEGIATRVREGEALIDTNRGGLEWRHEYCRELEEAIADRLRPLIERKRKSMAGQAAPPKLSESVRATLNKVCKNLNTFAEDELEELDVPTEPVPGTVDTLAIVPNRANVELEKPRTLSVYAPEDFVQREGRVVQITSTDPSQVAPLEGKVSLNPHPKYSGLWYTWFRVVAKTQGAEATITAALGSQKASAEVRVAPPKKRKAGKKPAGRKGGFVTDIRFDSQPNPLQRTVYSDGVITIFSQFPSVDSILQGASLEGITSPAGKVLLAELIGEAFSQAVVRRGIETGQIPVVPGGEIDKFRAEVNRLQKKYLHRIQEIIFAM